MLLGRRGRRAREKLGEPGLQPGGARLEVVAEQVAHDRVARQDGGGLDGVAALEVGLSRPPVGLVGGGVVVGRCGGAAVRLLEGAALQGRELSRRRPARHLEERQGFGMGRQGDRTSGPRQRRVVRLDGLARALVVDGQERVTAELGPIPRRLRGPAVQASRSGSGTWA